jgi:hypothetical protein
MRACRIARRVASMTHCQTPRMKAVSAQTLARKVFHLPFNPFSLWRGGLWLVSGGAERPSTGVRQFSGRGGVCRIAWEGWLAATPFITVSLVTNECQSGAIE